MHEFVSFNGQILSTRITNISAVSSAAMYGKGIFTTVAIYGSKPFLWEKHWNRLKDNAFRIGLDLEFSTKIVENSLKEIILKNKLIRGRVRLTFFDESANGIWSVESNKRTSLLITAADFRPRPEFLKLMISKFPVNSNSPIANVKSCNYLENILAIEDARKSGFDEAVRLNERGEIVSGCMANIFWKKKDEIFTPSLRTGCLAGTMREFLLEKHSISEVEETLKALQDADSIFLSSAGLGLKQAFL